MKPEEAILMMRNRIDTASEIAGKGTDGKAFEDMEMAIEALKEIQQYREIGTVEECREAVEKQRAKKPRLNYKPKFFGKATYTCPKCGNICLEKFANERQNNRYCWDCGQAIDWSENLEGMEDDR